MPPLASQASECLEIAIMTHLQFQAVGCSSGAWGAL